MENLSKIIANIKAAIKNMFCCICCNDGDVIINNHYAEGHEAELSGNNNEEEGA